MEGIYRRLEYATGYDLQEFLFTNNLRAFFNKGTRRSTGVEVFHLNDPTQPSSSHTMNQNYMNTVSDQDHLKVGNPKEMRNTSTETESKPLVVIFPREVEQKQTRQQANLEALEEEATKNEANLLNTTNFCGNP